MASNAGRFLPSCTPAPPTTLMDQVQMECFDLMESACKKEVPHKLATLITMRRPAPLHTPDASLPLPLLSIDRAT